MSCNGLEWIQPPSNESRLPGCYAYYDPPARIVDELNRLVDRIKRLEDAGDAMLNAWLMPEDSMEYCDWVALSADAKAKWHKARGEAKP
jgi:hypothetical protein